jgi:hypothetical protein
MFDKTHIEMNHWKWENARTFGDQLNYSIVRATSLRMVLRTGQHYSLYRCYDISAMLELARYREQNLADFLAVGLLQWNEIIESDNVDYNCVDSGKLSV